MSTRGKASRGDTGFDRVLAFTVPGSNARGRVVRLGPALDTVLSAHAYPPAITHLLAEALVLTALLGSLMKEEGSQLTVQAQAQGGAADLMVCDYRNGEIRGYVRHDPERLASLGANPSLETLFGEGYLAITFEPAASAERYQGIVRLAGSSLAEAFEHYFEKSEQVPTLLRVGVRSGGEGCIAGGMVIQHFPEGEEGRARLHARADYPQWEHVAALAGTIRHDELVDPGLSLESLVWRLFHDEPQVRVEPLERLARGCRCSDEHYQAILIQLPEAERAELREGDGRIPVDCAFCSKIFRIAV